MLAYDAESKQVVLFGGDDGASEYNDTWTWDGALQFRDGLLPALGPPDGLRRIQPRSRLQRYLAARIPKVIGASDQGACMLAAMIRPPIVPLMVACACGCRSYQETVSAPAPPAVSKVSCATTGLGVSTSH